MHTMIGRRFTMHNEMGHCMLHKGRDVHCGSHREGEYIGRRTSTESLAYIRPAHGNLPIDACVMCTCGTRRYRRSRFLPIATDATDAGHPVWTQAPGPRGKVFFLMVPTR